MDDKHNGKVLDATRLELFITLKYLLDKCDGPNNLSKTTELEIYAQENYGVLLDRRRANSIFESLVNFTTAFPDVLPFKVKQVPNKPRYYIEKCLFEKKAIEKISKAIKNDTSLSDTLSDKYVNEFLDKVCNEDTKKEIIKKLGTIQNKKHVSNETANKVSVYEMLRDEQKRFYFRLSMMPKPIDCANRDALRMATILVNAEHNQTNYYAAGIVYGVYTIGKKVEVCIYLPDQKTGFIANLKSIVFNMDIEPIEQWSTVNFKLEKCGVSSLEEWCEKYYKGSTGLLFDITFKFYPGENREILIKRKESFEEFFKTEMNYELVDREVVMLDHDGNKRTLLVKDAVVKVKCNYNSFRKWYWESGAYENTVILEPKRLNNRLLEVITARFAARLQKYGESREERITRYEHLERERNSRLEKPRVYTESRTKR